MYPKFNNNALWILNRLHNTYTLSEHFWADFAVCDWGRYFKSRCDAKLSQIEGNGRTFSHIELSNLLNLKPHVVNKKCSCVVVVVCPIYLLMGIARRRCTRCPSSAPTGPSSTRRSSPATGGELTIGLGKCRRHRRRIYTKEKAKVFAAVWGTEFIQFGAILHQDDLKCNSSFFLQIILLKNSSFSSFHPGAK